VFSDTSVGEYTTFCRGRGIGPVSNNRLNAKPDLVRRGSRVFFTEKDEKQKGMTVPPQTK